MEDHRPGLEKENLSSCSGISDIGLAAPLAEVSPATGDLGLVVQRRDRLGLCRLVVSESGLRRLGGDGERRRGRVLELGFCLRCDGLALAFGARIASRLVVLNLRLSLFLGDESVSGTTAIIWRDSM